jgi:hypothetical protein
MRLFVRRSQWEFWQRLSRGNKNPAARVIEGHRKIGAHTLQPSFFGLAFVPWFVRTEVEPI